MQIQSNDRGVQPSVSRSIQQSLHIALLPSGKPSLHVIRLSLTQVCVSDISRYVPPRKYGIFISSDSRGIFVRESETYDHSFSFKFAILKRLAFLPSEDFCRKRTLLDVCCSLVVW